MPQISPTGNKGANGFTLIEVLAALLLLAVISSLVLPEMFRSICGMESKVALRQIERDLSRIYHESKGNGLTMEAIFKPEAEEYQVIIGAQSLSRPLYGLKYQSDAESKLTFKPDGKIEGAESIRFEDALGREFIWRAEPLAGE